MSQLEDLFNFQLKALLPKGTKFEREVKLVPSRRFRWDFVVGDLAIEVQGATFVKGAHSSGVGIQRDCDKGYYALKAGYKPLNLTGQDVKSGEGIQKVKSLLGMKK